MHMKGSATILALVIMSTVVSASMLAYYATSLMVEFSYKRLEHMQKRGVGEALLSLGAVHGVHSFNELMHTDSKGAYVTTVVRSPHELLLLEGMLPAVRDMELWMHFIPQDRSLVCQAHAVKNNEDQCLASCTIVCDASKKLLISDWEIT